MKPKPQPKPLTYQETFYQQKLARGEKRRRMLKDAGMIVSILAGMIAVLMLVVCIIKCLVGGWEYERDYLTLERRLDNLEFRSANARQRLDSVEALAARRALPDLRGTNIIWLNR